METVMPPRGDARALSLPRFDEGDLLVANDQWIALSPMEAQLVRTLLNRWGRVTSYTRLSRALWPAGQRSKALLSQVVVRARRRVEPLGLEIEAVRGRGYVMRSVTSQ